MASFTRTASAEWQGTGKEGKGNLTTQSGVLSTSPYGFNTRFGDTKGTNPEELLAASHAGCFTMALAFALAGAGFTPTRLATSAAVTWPRVWRSRRMATSRSARTTAACHAKPVVP